MPCNVQILLVSSSQQSFKVLVFILMNWNKQTNKQKDCHLPRAEYWSRDWNHKSLTSLRKFSFPVLLSSVQSLSRVWLFVTAAHQASLSITNSRSLPKLMSIELMMPSNHLKLSSPSPPALNLSQHQGLFQWVSSSHQEAKVLEFQLQHQSFQWTPRTDLL